jgi:hypothetical protein
MKIKSLRSKKLAPLLLVAALVPMANAGALRAVGRVSRDKVGKPVYHGMEKAGHGVKIGAQKTGHGVKVAAVKTGKVVV